MKLVFSTFLFLFGCFALSGQGKFAGTWQNIDDEDGKPKSHIQIYEEGGELKAKVIKLLAAATVKTCTECKGDLKGKPIEGMLLVKNMKKESDKVYSGGEILNPKNGKSYSCTMTLKDENTIKLRGYIGISLMGKTQYWYRVK